MKKSEAEPVIRSLTHQWYGTLPEEKKSHPSFSAFTTWMNANGYSHYLSFRSVAGADYDAEMWFDQELKQTWRR